MNSDGFLQNWFVWRDAVIVGTISGAALAYLGVWVVLRRIRYVPLALSQVSSAGVVAALLLWGFVSGGGHHDTGSRILPMLLDPAWLSLAAALGLSALFARSRAEGANGVVVAYLVASALVLVLGSFIRQDLHDLESVLFGSAVLVEPVQVLYVSAAAAVTLAVHAVLYRRFLFASFDPEAAGAAGIPLVRTNLWLYGSIALMVSIATRAIGALPAFGLMILPALAGLAVSRSMRTAFALAIAVGAVSASGGYYLSYVGELPTGAMMVALAGALYAAALVWRRAAALVGRR
jgi:zinc transport system permease protein